MLLAAHCSHIPIAAWSQLLPDMCDLRAVLLTGDSVAKIGDVGLARFMPNDYMSQQAAIGTALPGRHPLCAKSVSRGAVPSVH